MHTHLSRAAAGVDALIVDTVPMIGTLTLAAMQAADLILVPVEPTADAVLHLPKVLYSADRVKQAHTPVLLVLTRADRRDGTTAETVGVLQERYPGMYSGIEIPMSAKAKRANAAMRPAVLHARGTMVAKAYTCLAHRVALELQRTAQRAASGEITHV
jgi:chromosome partitioning protein